MELLLVARSIGKEHHWSTLSEDLHAGLVVDFGAEGHSNHWIAQGGPTGDGLLEGTVRQATVGWYEDFSRSTVWKDPSVELTLPVLKLMTLHVDRLTLPGLRAHTDALNHLRLVYVYQTGPNSNTYVRLLLRRMGLDPGPLGLALNGWDWNLAPGGK